MGSGRLLHAGAEIGRKEIAGAAPPPKITQFYATAPKLQRGEKETLCYGVENATDVWLSPPRQN